MNLKHSRNRNKTARRNAFPPGLREGEQCRSPESLSPRRKLSGRKVLPYPHKALLDCFIHCSSINNKYTFMHSPSIHLLHLHSAPVLNRITSDDLCETLRRRDCLVNYESQTLAEQKQNCETECVSSWTARGRIMPESGKSEPPEEIIWS
ncbi:hypothetical protein CDAR_116581 [Caerostris darwini]|uniref:Uncharacterized protein n=1 Tax=Caerostris darwini TaxID=1538125 RepID=A0AAV4QZ56_9ARAC|nr:hypothetical protein CDAR_116581 [Caerostris darwini]